jgi:hypothetical protein
MAPKFELYKKWSKKEYCRDELSEECSRLQREGPNKEY